MTRTVAGCKRFPAAATGGPHLVAVGDGAATHREIPPVQDRPDVEDRLN
jgi:hypothetical protein